MGVCKFMLSARAAFTLHLSPGFRFVMESSTWSWYSYWNLWKQSIKWTQLSVFSSLRSFEWLLGLCILLLLNTLLIPLPLVLVPRCGGSKFASRTAAVLDLTLDTLYLMLSTIVLNVESFVGGDWLLAVFGLVIPAFGALKTLHEIFVAASTVAAPSKYKLQSRVVNVAPRKIFHSEAGRYGYLLIIVTATVSLVSSTYFLTAAINGRRICEAEMGEILTAGASPLVVVEVSNNPYCNISQIEVIKAPWQQGMSKHLQLNALPLCDLQNDTPQEY